ncbi:hypothetical protein ACJX0J_007598, partial [Zea mays]
KTDSCFTEEKREVLDKLTILIPILVFWISGLLAPNPWGAWLQFRICYYMFALVFVVFDVETVFLYPWAMSFDVLGVSVFIEAFIFTLNPRQEDLILTAGTCDYMSKCLNLNTSWLLEPIPILIPVIELGGVLLCRKKKEQDQDNAVGLTLQIKAGDWDSIVVILYLYGYNYLCSQCAYDIAPDGSLASSLPKRIILESRFDNNFMFTYTTQFQILFKASFLFSNLENHIFIFFKKKKKCLEIYLLTPDIYLLTLD